MFSSTKYYPVVNIPLVLCETPSTFPLDDLSTRCPPNTRLSNNLPLLLSLRRKVLCIISTAEGEEKGAALISFPPRVHTLPLPNK